MPILNRVRYNVADFAYEISLVFKDDYSYQQWIANQPMITGATVLESQAIHEEEGMAIIEYVQPVTVEAEVTNAAPVVPTNDAADTTTASTATTAAVDVVSPVAATAEEVTATSEETAPASAQ